MDIARPDLSRRRRRRRLMLGLTAALALAAVTVALSRLEPAAPSVDRATVWTNKVRRGPMTRAVRGNGQLVPREVRWITARSGGRIESIPLLPGVAVEPDTVLMELSNPELLQAEADAQATVQSAEARRTTLGSQLESERLARASALAQLESELALAKIEAENDQDLLERGFVPRMQATRSQARVDELESRLAFERQQVEVMAESSSSQLTTHDAEIANHRKKLEHIRRQVAELQVRAGVSGVLQRLGDETTLRVGQQLSAGATIASVADPTLLKAEIRVPETQARDIQHEQQAMVDTRNGEVPGHVVRIDPAVRKGTVTVDIALDGPLPRGARPDLAVDGTITLEHIEDALHTGRPADGQAHARVSLFKLVDGGRFAERVPVQLGRTSVDSVEILEGLQVGDEVILSDMSEWDRVDRIKLD